MLPKLIISLVAICSLLAMPQSLKAHEIEIKELTPKLTPKEYIKLYAEKYKTSEKVLLSVAKCESNFNPRAWNKKDPNGGSKGIMQFQTKTFSHYSKKVGIKNPDIWNVDHQAETAAYMFSKGQQRQWSCYHKLV